MISPPPPSGTVSETEAKEVQPSGNKKLFRLLSKCPDSNLRRINLSLRIEFPATACVFIYIKLPSSKILSSSLT